MKITELVEIMNKGSTKMMQLEQQQAVAKKALEVKEYIGIKDKKKLVQSIIDECIYYSDGIFKFDESEKYICFIMKTIAAYTNIELSDDIEDDYDELCRAKLLTLVVNTFKSEYDEVNVLLQMKCDYILSGNTIEAQLGAFLSDLNDRLGGLMDGLQKSVDKFDFNNLPIDKEDLKKLLSFIK